jgi:hypothetical protein
VVERTLDLRGLIRALWLGPPVAAREEAEMNSVSELLWTISAIGTVDLLFVVWLAARASRRGRSRSMVASAEMLGARTRRQRV